MIKHQDYIVTDKYVPSQLKPDDVIEKWDTDDEYYYKFTINEVHAFRSGNYGFGIKKNEHGITGIHFGRDHSGSTSWTIQFLKGDKK